MKDLGVLADLAGQSESRPNAISLQGRVAAANVVNGSYRALLYGGAWTNLGTLGGANSYGAGINESNLVVGHSLTVGGTDHAFLWTPGGTGGVPGNVQMKDLGTLGGSASGAFAINRLGQITGYAATTKEDHAFVYSNGVVRDLGPLFAGGLANSYGYGINDLGHVVGTAYNSSYSVARAFFFNGTSAADLGALGGNDASALAINNTDRVAGYASTADGFDHAFRFVGGAMTDLGTLGGSYSYGIGLNNSNVVVGGSFVDAANTIYHAFICPTNTMYDLNNFLDSSGAGWALVEARAINDRGQIIGTGNYRGASHGFLLSPAPRIVQQPTNTTVACQGTARFTVSAVPAPLLFQWYKGALSSGSPLPSATNATLTLTNVTGTAAGPYFAVVTGTFSSATSAVATLTVIDSTAPVITGCPPNLTNNTDPGLCSAVVTWPSPIALDACEGPVPVTCTPPSGSRFPKGVTGVTCRAGDSSRNTNTCVFTVTVVDREAPDFTNIPGPVQGYAAPGAGSVPVSWDPLAATDNCDGKVTVKCLPPSGSPFPKGTSTVVYSASDANRNTNSGSFTVTVSEAIPPIITSARVIGTSVVITFTTLSGAAYSVECASDIPGASWTESASGIHGTGGLVNATNSSPPLATSHFYRVKMLLTTTGIASSKTAK
ncbi:MAG TPA: HYR domain-containing protein [Verrucomicrobiae bacterium]